MSDVTFPIAGLGSSAAPLDYKVQGDQEFTLLGIRAVFDGTGTASSWLPYVQILSGAGNEMIHSEGTAVLAGGSADVSFFPRVRRAAASPFSFTYAQTIAALKVGYTCVAEWQLDDGGAPYLDTSGFSLADPADLHIQVLATPMTQALADGPLADFPAGPSVRFNFDGDSRTSTGDYLTDSVATPGRYAFLGNAIFTAIAWLKPTQGVNSHNGPIFNTVTPSGGIRDDGWRINVIQPTLECRLERWCNVWNGGAIEYFSVGSLDPTKWTMVAMTYDGATIRGYANGVLLGSTASAGSIGAGTNMILGAGTHRLSDYVEWALGAQSQCSVWANTFTDDDIAGLYAAGIS